MKLKQKPGDFRVEELLDQSLLVERGRHRVYRVSKRKLTSMEALARVAREAGVAPGEVSIAGLKDRQGVTVQYMSAPGGRRVELSEPSIKIETLGSSARALSSQDSAGNAFAIVLRDVSGAEARTLQENLEPVRRHGLPNYFGEQRFGNLRGHQGWIARDLALGRAEEALKRLLASRNEHDDPDTARFKDALLARWGDWRACRDIAGRFGAHMRVFEHLSRNEEDHAGAFRYIASKLRLIHLYAWQSHLWNRAVSSWISSNLAKTDTLVVRGPEGPLAFSRGAYPEDASMRGVFRLPGAGLEDVEHPLQRDLLALALRGEGLQPGEFRIEGVSGFALKGEDRPLHVVPRALRLVQRDEGQHVLSFELPRGAYATLVVARLAGGALEREFGERGEGDGRQSRGGPRGRVESKGGERGRSGAGRSGNGPDAPHRRAAHGRGADGSERHGFAGGGAPGAGARRRGGAEDRDPGRGAGRGPGGGSGSRQDRGGGAPGRHGGPRGGGSGRAAKDASGPERSGPDRSGPGRSRPDGPGPRGGGSKR
jgi:tRNA pseudouridine13 synthase